MSTSPILDPIAIGVASGWNVTDASTVAADRSFEADVVIIGSGAGGGVTAEILALAGLKVLIVEEGGLKSSQDFKMREADAYPALYQNRPRARRATRRSISCRGAPWAVRPPSTGPRASARRPAPSNTGASILACPAIPSMPWRRGSP